ncbi:hypothetical protein D3C85_1253650 [compost metagenome]
MGGLPGCLRSIVAGWSLTGQKLPGKIFSRPNASNRLALVEFRDGAVFQTGGVSLHCVSDVAVAHAEKSCASRIRKSSKLALAGR